MNEDPSLALPPPVLVEPPFTFPPVVRAPDIGLDAHVTLTGPGVIAGGKHPAAITGISIFGLPVINDLQVVDARVTGIELSPLGLERWITIADREMIERTHLLGDRTCVIMEWVRLAETDVTDDECDALVDDDPANIRIRWRVGPGTPGTASDGSLHLPSPATTRSRILWHADETRLRVDLRETDISICFSAGPGTARITAVPTPAGTSLLECALSAVIPPGKSLRLIISAGAGDDPDAARSTLSNVADRIRARSAVLRRRHREHIRLVSPDPDADLAVAWAKQRIDWTHAATPLTGLAALAAGEFGQAGECIAALARRQTGAGAIPGAKPPAGLRAGALDRNRESTADWLQLVARHLAWTGELPLAQAVWPRVRLAIAWLARPAIEAPSASLLASLTMAAETVGDTDAIRKIEALRTAPTEIAESDTQTIRFPASRTVACTPDVRVAMAPLFALVDGLLGAAPDAVRGRLRLRPAAPPAWERYQVSGLRMGEAVVDLGYQRDGMRHEFTLDQPSGAIPIRVIFEPVIPGRALVAATVDGRQASLVPRPHAHGLIVPVQVVMDHERSIVLMAVD